MKEARVKYIKEFTIDSVDERVFGGFMEHMGRCIYEGVYDPESKYADDNGFRGDVLNALGELNMTAMRYPGGNFVSGYHWIDGIGPKEKRPTVRELAWQSIEPNQFGTDEYIAMCRQMNWTPMITVNLGTGSPEEARNWLEYCNCSGGTKYADMRVKNGNIEPYGVKLWCLGNEMDGHWQIGHVPAGNYAIKAQQAARMMKKVDRSIELVVCGSSSKSIHSYMDWDDRVLSYCWDDIDYISLHSYASNEKNNTVDYLAFSEETDAQIEDMAAVCRYVRAKRKSKRDVKLCFDEWNVWYKDKEMNGAEKYAPHLLEEIYNLEDAIVVAGFLNSFIRHADVIKIANLAQIVNVIAPLITIGDKLLVQSIYHVFRMFSRRKNGLSLMPCVVGDKFQTSDGREVNYIDTSAIFDAEKNLVKIFLCNRSVNDQTKVIIDLLDAEIENVEDAEMLTGSHAKVHNNLENQCLVESNDIKNKISVKNGKVFLDMPALSIVAVTLKSK